jgi:thymidylate synthase (FAD)
MADMTVEIVTNRAISQQILRHRSFSFQEFSQRYAETTNICEYPARRQDVKNRQNSIDDLSPEVQEWFSDAQQAIRLESSKLYQQALDHGIAKECARFLLPMGTETRLYMKGSIRSFIHYCKVRCHPSTQLEHREIADKVKAILLNEYPSLTGVI